MCGDQTLASQFPRLYALDIDKDCLVSQRFANASWSWHWRRALRSGHELEQLDKLLRQLPSELLISNEDVWNWNFMGKSFFSVAVVRKFLDQKLLPSTKNSFCWNKSIPKKINIFTWRLFRNAIPTHDNLFLRGVDVDTISCKICNNGFDGVAHLFYNCSLVSETRIMLSKWLHYNIPGDQPDIISNWYKNLQIKAQSRKILEAIIFIWWWHIWKERNNELHNGKHENSVDVINSIVSLSFNWISNRDKKHHYVWTDWIVNPLIDE